jgi:membrane associated rhomboid family serine protease
MIPLRDIIPSRTRPVLTVTLIALNVFVFLLESSLGPREAERFAFTYGLVPAAISLPSIFTSMFVHAGAAHLLGNMLFLWIFGDNVEDRLGHGRFLVFYLLCGTAAALAQTALMPASRVPMVGASGAIAGVMGAYLVLYPHSRVLMLVPFPLLLFELPAVYFLAFWFIVQFLNGLGSLARIGAPDLGGGIAFWAHVAGFVAGVGLVRIMRRKERERVEWWDTRRSGDRVMW